jgi:diacylglycerol kinase family enzyme
MKGEEDREIPVLFVLWVCGERPQGFAGGCRVRRRYASCLQRSMAYPGIIPALINSAVGESEAARAVLRKAGNFELRDVAPTEMADAARAAVASGAPRILVAGGDGSVAAAAGAIAGTSVELAILPCGTLNHLAKDLGLPLDLGDAARVAVSERSATLDAATVNGRLFLNTSSVGAYVTFVRMRERLERRMSYHAASMVAAARLFVGLPVFRVSMQVDGERREYLTPLVFIGVGERELKLPLLGRRVADGTSGLHVMVVCRRSGARTLALALAAAARGVDAVAATPAMDAFLVNQCVIEPRMHVAAVDGELVPIVPPLRYRHLPRCLRVVVE